MEQLKRKVTDARDPMKRWERQALAKVALDFEKGQSEKKKLAEHENQQALLQQIAANEADRELARQARIANANTLNLDSKRFQEQERMKQLEHKTKMLQNRAQLLEQINLSAASRPEPGLAPTC